MLRKIFAEIGAWSLIIIAWVITRLPIKIVFVVGPWLGKLVYLTARKRRKIAEINIALCFPDYNGAERRKLVEDSFTNLGAAAIEVAFSWLNPKKDVSQYFKIKGMEYLRKAQAEANGVLLLGGHYSTMDVLSQPITKLANIDIVYKKNTNTAWEFIQNKGRQRRHAEPNVVIERNNIRKIIQRLRAGHTVWFAADQDFGSKHSVFAPFFGILSATAKSPASIARLTNCTVLYVWGTRDWQTKSWTLEFGPPVSSWPEGSPESDAHAFNKSIERIIRNSPAQYHWVHKRFKTTPHGLVDRYSSIDA